MSGFGSGPFGVGPFGRFNWGRQVLFLDLPQVDRDFDAEPEQNGRLEKFSESIRHSFDFLLEQAVDYETLRDPDTVRTQFNGVINVTITSIVANAETGRTLNVFLDAPDPNDPFNPLGDTTVGWLLEDGNGRTFTVNSVCKLDVNGDVVPYVEVFGISEDPIVGAATLRPPSQISELGADFGIEVDQNEPEKFQRSSVRDVTQWLDLKGTAKAYDIIGKIAGYRVEALGLWRVSTPPPDFIPVGNLFELPLGSGKFYTDLSPDRPLFDDLVADSFPLDLYCFEEPTWSTEFPGGPPTPLPADGTPVSDAIGIPVRSVPIISSTDIGDGVWELRIGPTALEEVMTLTELGNWYVTFPTGDAGNFYIETVPTEPVAGEWVFRIVAGDTPAFGATVDLMYDCPTDFSCEICRASVIRVNVVPAEVLTEPDALLDGVLGRLTSKILQVVPAHVRVTQISLNIGPVQAAFNIQATVQAQTSVFAVASYGFYFDVIPADDMPLDPDHLVATVTAFTVP